MAEMLRIGWHKEQLDSLEILFWSVRDADGREMKTKFTPNVVWGLSATKRKAQKQLELDAARYRFLRGIIKISGDALDKEVDKAMRKSKKQEKGTR